MAVRLRLSYFAYALIVFLGLQLVQLRRVISSSRTLLPHSDEEPVVLSTSKRFLAPLRKREDAKESDGEAVEERQALTDREAGPGSPSSQDPGGRQQHAVEPSATTAAPGSIPQISTMSTLRNVEHSSGIVDVPPECKGKEPLLKTIRLVRGGIQPDEGEICKRLPLWANVTELYGAEPLLYGSSTCGTYHSYLDGARPRVKVGGAIGSGTKLLSRLLQLNLYRENSTAEEDVFDGLPWGEHGLVSHRVSETTFSPLEVVREDRVLPVLVARDPFRWMQSMCKQDRSDLQWTRVESHCPNLVPTREDMILVDHRNDTNFTSVPVSVHYPDRKLREAYVGLDHYFWLYYAGYINGLYPFLLVRYEDLLLHPEEVIDYVAACSGLKRRETFRYFTRSTDKDATAYINALVTNTQSTGRFDGMTDEDLEHADTWISEGVTVPLHYTEPSKDFVAPPLVYSKSKLRSALVK